MKKKFVILLIIILAITICIFAGVKLHDSIVSINNNSSMENQSDEILKKYTDEKDKEATTTENKILEIAKKYSPEEMNTIMKKLDGKSIYSENIELEYEFDNLILNILETKELNNDEKETLIDHMEQEYGNVKSNQELSKRIEDVCKIKK